MRPTLAFFGDKPLNPNLVNDALGDHLRYGPLGSDGYFETRPETIEVDLVLAADTPEGVKALGPVLEWSARADLGYSLILRDGLDGSVVEDLVADADAVERVAYAAERLSELLCEDADRGEDAALVLLCGTDEIDDASAELIRMTGGVALVYNLGDALLPVDVHPYLEEGEPETPLEEPEVGAAVIDLASGPLVVTPAEEALNLVVEQDKSMFEALREDLDAIEADNAAKFQAMRDLIGVYEDAHEAEMKQLREAKAIGERVGIAAPAEGNVIAPTKTKREWYDEEAGIWKPMGRGRPRQNVQIREVPA